MKQTCLNGVIYETLLYLESVYRIIKISASAEMVLTFFSERGVLMGYFVLFMQL